MVRILTILLFSTFIITSCNQEQIFEAKMSAVIDGQSWSTLTRVTKLQNGNFIISGTSSDQKVILITVFGDQAGTYSLTSDSLKVQFSAVYEAEANTSLDDNFIATSGTVVISEVNTEEQRISGTFQFNGRNLTSTVSITSGEFVDLKYSESE